MKRKKANPGKKLNVNNKDLQRCYKPIDYVKNLIMTRTAGFGGGHLNCFILTHCVRKSIFGLALGNLYKIKILKNLNQCLTLFIFSLVSFYFSAEIFTVTTAFYVFLSQLSNMISEVRPNGNKNKNVLFQVNSFHLQPVEE